MRHEAAPAHRRGRPLPEKVFPPEFVRNAYTLAIRRAARDAHRTVCDRDCVACETCRQLAHAIAEAKWTLNHANDAT